MSHHALARKILTGMRSEVGLQALFPGKDPIAEGALDARGRGAALHHEIAEGVGPGSTPAMPLLGRGAPMVPLRAHADLVRALARRVRVVVLALTVVLGRRARKRTVGTVAVFDVAADVGGDDLFGPAPSPVNGHRVVRRRSAGMLLRHHHYLRGYLIH